MLNVITDSLSVVLYWVFFVISSLFDVSANTASRVYNALNLVDIFDMTFNEFSSYLYINNGSVAWTTFFGSLSSLLPLFAVGIAISAILLGVKIIRSFVWGSK